MSFKKLVKFEVNGDLDDDWTLDRMHRCHVRSVLARAARVCLSIGLIDAASDQYELTLLGFAFRPDTEDVVT